MTGPARYGSNPPDVVFLAHALDRSGPPIYLLHLLRWLERNSSARAHVVALEAGRLEAEYRRLAEVTVVGEPSPVRIPRGQRPVTDLRDAARRLRLVKLRGTRLVHVNTAWSVRALPYLPVDIGCVVVHAHELDVGLEFHLPPPDRQLAFQRADHWVAASAAVATNLRERWRVPGERISIHHEMVDTTEGAEPALGQERRLRAENGIPPGATLFGTAAIVNWRKGPDLFVEIAHRVTKDAPDIDPHFVWIGVGDEDRGAARLRTDAVRAGLADRIHLIPVTCKVAAWMHCLTAFILSAREDAYPLAALEAAVARCPVVCFDSGGMPEFVETDAGAVIDYPDVAAMARELIRLARDSERRAATGERARRRVVERHDVNTAAPRLWQDLNQWAEFHCDC